MERVGGAFIRKVRFPKATPFSRDSAGEACHLTDRGRVLAIDLQPNTIKITKPPWEEIYKKERTADTAGGTRGLTNGCQVLEVDLETC